ncbi:DnaJ C-terminal domain-containing protein [Pseudaquidulcibacter saccharophilus]|uniref:DnaJ C-terminal domain-containing protein n=1 Tax=Pseudaquidulcibacter saccharophilus TaxID=2831900 RepID=UPI001EFF228D|nr:DnaJ C-terminal domain-containing protein [Pseudaquidulcibacter saccharophilus]
MAENPYNILGVNEGAPIAEVRKAYRKLAKEFHPDKNPNNKAAEEKFKKISAAFSFLDDDERKAKFDRGEIDADGNPKFAGFGGGQGGFNGGFAGGDPFGPGGPFAGMNMGGGRAKASSGFGNPDFEDFFGDIFGANLRGGRGARTGSTRPPGKGTDLSTTLQIETLDAIVGAKKRVTVNGSAIDITIPSGVTEGQVLRLRGKGGAGVAGGANGDLLVTINIKPDGNYRIDGIDVHTDLQITLTEALEGAKIEVPTPLGKVALSIKPNANSGQTLRLKGRGVAKGNKIGDLYIHLEITLPDGDNSELLQLLANWSRKAEAPKKRS